LKSCSQQRGLSCSIPCILTGGARIPCVEAERDHFSAHSYVYTWHRTGRGEDSSLVDDAFAVEAGEGCHISAPASSRCRRATLAMPTNGPILGCSCASFSGGPDKLRREENPTAPRRWHPVLHIPPICGFFSLRSGKSRVVAGELMKEARAALPHHEHVQDDTGSIPVAGANRRFPPFRRL
jgi:hypothetical protein